MGGRALTQVALSSFSQKQVWDLKGVGVRGRVGRKTGRLEAKGAGVR